MKKKAEEKGVKLLLPVDNRIGDEFSNDCNMKVVPCGQIPGWLRGLDIRWNKEKLFADAVKDAKTVVMEIYDVGCFENAELRITWYRAAMLTKARLRQTLQPSSVVVIPQQLLISWDLVTR